MALSGTKLTGSNPKEKRVDFDYYATNPIAAYKLMEKFYYHNMVIYNNNCLECCVGDGNIIKGVEQIPQYMLQAIIKGYDGNNWTCIDIVDRDYPNTIVCDFLTYETDKRFDFIITNPPYKIAQEFIEKSLDLLNENGVCAMFLKIQFLEADKRKEFFKKYPPKYIYVFSDRMATWRNGEPFDYDRKTGKNKKWSTTFTHAWFVWVKGSTTEPIIRWI